MREEMNRAGALELLDAGRAAGGAVAGDRAAGRIRAGAPALQGSARARLRAPARRTRRSSPTSRAASCKSYRQLPVNFYQIQTKFRDESRPALRRHARARVRHEGRATRSTPTTPTSKREYRDMYDAYTRIFTRLGLAVPRGRGGHGRDRRHRLARIPGARRLRRGRDRVLPASDYAANVELAEALAPAGRARRAARGDAKGADARARRTCEEVAALLGMPLAANRQVRSLRRWHGRRASILLLLRGDHTLNEIKAQKMPGLELPLRHRAPRSSRALGCKPGYIGPVGAEGAR